VHFEQGGTMRVRRLLTAAAVMALPLGLIAVPAGSASATAATAVAATKGPKAVKGAGSVTCGIGGDATFTPPLTAEGTPGYPHESVQFHVFAVDCTGGSPGATSGTIVSRTVRVKDVTVGGTKVAGACHAAPFDPTLLLKNRITWSPAGLKRSHVKLALTPVTDADGTLTGYTGRGTAKGSYAGPSTASLNIDALADLIALQDACTDGDPGTSVSEIAFGPNDSMTLG
jgi:hypothetical protein